MSAGRDGADTIVLTAGGDTRTVSPALLFGAIPGGTDLALIGILNLLIAILVGYWVYRDASRRHNDNAALWAAGVGIASLFLSFVGFLIVFGLYLFVGRD